MHYKATSMLMAGAVHLSARHYADSSLACFFLSPGLTLAPDPIVWVGKDRTHGWPRGGVLELGGGDAASKQS